VSELSEQNEILVQTIEDLENDSNEKVASLDNKLMVCIYIYIFLFIIYVIRFYSPSKWNKLNDTAGQANIFIYKSYVIIIPLG